MLSSSILLISTTWVLKVFKYSVGTLLSNYARIVGSSTRSRCGRCGNSIISLIDVITVTLFLENLVSNESPFEVKGRLSRIRILSLSCEHYKLRRLDRVSAERIPPRTPESETVAADGINPDA